MPPKVLTDADRLEFLYAIIKVKNVTFSKTDWSLIGASLATELEGEAARSRWRGIDAKFTKDGVLKEGFKAAESKEDNKGEPKVKKPRAKKAKVSAAKVEDEGDDHQAGENGGQGKRKRKREDDAEDEENGGGGYGSADYA